MNTTETFRYQSKAFRKAPALLSDIRQGRFGIDCALPKEDALADIYGVSRSTVRRMIAILEQSGEINREPRKGIWIGRSDFGSQGDPGTASYASGGDNEKLPVCAMIQTDASLGTDVPNPELLLLGYLAGMNEEIREERSSLIVHHVPWENCLRAFESDLLPSIFRVGRVSGAILVNNYPPDAVKRFASRYPCVSIIYDYDAPQMDIVGLNDAGAVMELVKHLFDHGHRRIAFAGEMAKFGWGRTRLAGYVEAVLALGVEFRTENIFDFSDRQADGELFARLQSRLADGVTAIVCGNDEMGHELVARLRKVGIETPRDVSITGFDPLHTPAGSFRLTSTRLPAEQMGAAAVRMLFERNHKPEIPMRRLLLDCTLLEGDSVANVNQ